MSISVSHGLAAERATSEVAGEVQPQKLQGGCNLIGLHRVQPQKLQGVQPNRVAPGATSEVARRNLLRNLLRDFFKRGAAARRRSLVVAARARLEVVAGTSWWFGHA